MKIFSKTYKPFKLNVGFQSDLKMLLSTIKEITLIGLTLSLASICHAQELKGGPTELAGKYGNSPAQCQSHNRKSDEITTISATTYEFCGGSACGAKILSHKKTKDGYILTLQGREARFKESFKIVDENTIEIGNSTYVRCSTKDIRAGVGLDLPSPYSLTRAPDGAFSAYYAMTAANACSFKSDEKRANSIIATALIMWIKFKKDGNMPPSFGKTYEADAEQFLRMNKNSAEYAVREDKAELKDFCDEILDVFGNNGRVLPDLIEDKRRRS